MLKSNDLRLPLILACCGSTKNAQIASDLANVMEHEGYAKQLFTVMKSVYPEPQWVTEVRTGRPIMLLDGCNNCCMQGLFSAYRISASWHIILSDYGLHPTLDGLHSLQQLNTVIRYIQGILSTQKS